MRVSRVLRINRLNSGKIHNPIKIRPIAIPACRKYPPPTTMPRAAAIQMVEAVVSPTTCPLSRRITPAPMNPIPATILAAMRTGSLATPSSKDRMVNSADPKQMKVMVRNPAALSWNSRSAPISHPIRMATNNLITISETFVMVTS